MAKKFSELTSKMSPESLAQSELQLKAMLAEMPLHELRRARGLSQQILAEILRVQQPAIAKLERRTDMYISTLRSHIEAMGGQLEIIARFPDGAVKITNFADVDSGAAVAETPADYRV
ncbi:MAG: transcriptional regulator [Thiothrix sp.]|nr:MAG: transcriptional regulator [Thiothrix sp.]